MRVVFSVRVVVLVIVVVVFGGCGGCGWLFGCVLVCVGVSLLFTRL